MATVITNFLRSTLQSLSLWGTCFIFFAKLAPVVFVVIFDWHFICCLLVGNAHAEDDHGRMFYIAGRVNEKATVCDEDKPIVTRQV